MHLTLMHGERLKVMAAEWMGFDIGVAAAI
jgi:hypothetical protein